MLALGDKAWLLSEVLVLPQAACLEWYLHLYGDSIGFLNVYYHKIGDANPILLEKIGGVTNLATFR